MFCKHCGESISEDADFCEKCGKPQKPQNYHSSKNVKVVRYKKLDGKRIGLIAAGCAAALLILLGVCGDQFGGKGISAGCVIGVSEYARKRTGGEYNK